MRITLAAVRNRLQIFKTLGVNGLWSSPPLPEHLQDQESPGTLDELADRYLQWLEDRAYSQHTVYSRALYLGEFRSWCGSVGIKTVTNLDPTAIEHYQHKLARRRSSTGRRLSPQTQRLHLSCLRGFCRWLKNTKILTEDHSVHLILPKIPTRIPRSILSTREIDLLLAVPDEETRTGVRDRAMLETLVSTGMRRSELSNLMVADFDSDSETVLIREGKGGFDRVVPIGKRALDWVHHYLEKARPKSVVDPDPGIAFLNRFGSRFVPNGISKMVSSAIKKSGIGETGSTHLIRHSVATLMLDQGADIRVIQELLGHKKLTTTQIYTRVSIKTLKRVHRETHPYA